mmetsp:Transcript_36687/g.117710  ORF Transcript_36687/g.117710 Transcript_36687/m.117710 type:complete len:130 (+) Transcript_36687:66-455(+)
MLRVARVSAIPAMGVASSHRSKCEELTDQRTFRILERQYQHEPLELVEPSDLRKDLASPAMRLVLFGETHDDPRAQSLETDGVEAVVSPLVCSSRPTDRSSSSVPCCLPHAQRLGSSRRGHRRRNCTRS